eukprot:356988-Chlamydomonas_euryale.AAC.3
MNCRPAASSAPFTLRAPHRFGLLASGPAPAPTLPPPGCRTRTQPTKHESTPLHHPFPHPPSQKPQTPTNQPSIHTTRRSRVVGRRQYSSGQEATLDDSGHGTAVASVVGGKTAGVSNEVLLYDVKVRVRGASCLVLCFHPSARRSVRAFFRPATCVPRCGMPLAPRTM